LGRPLQPSFYFHEHFWFLFNFFETPAVAKLRSKRRKRHTGVPTEFHRLLSVSCDRWSAAEKWMTWNDGGWGRPLRLHPTGNISPKRLWLVIGPYDFEYY
jgi:hypothetical protein